MSRNRKSLVPSSRALPTNVADLEKQRVVKRSQTLADQVEQCYLVLYESTKLYNGRATFRQYREGLEPEETVEGSISHDDSCAAEMIRKQAEEMGLTLVMEANLNDISKSLRVAERRVLAARSQRKKAPAAKALPAA